MHTAYLIKKAFKGTVGNQTLQSLPGGSFEIMVTVPVMMA